MICILTFGHHLTSGSRERRSKFDLEPSVSTNTYFDTSRRENHYSVLIIALTFLVQKLFTSNLWLIEVVDLILYYFIYRSALTYKL